MTTAASGEPTEPAVMEPPHIQPPQIQRGPGVVPPFAAPPQEGVRRRRWIAISIGAAVAVLCCGGGAVGFGVLAVTTQDQLINGARTVVTSYMNDWKKQDYPAAYQLVCDDEKDQQTVGEFAASIDEDLVYGFVVGKPVVDQNEVIVPVAVNFASGDNADIRFVVVTDSDGSHKVCGTQ